MFHLGVIKLIFNLIQIVQTKKYVESISVDFTHVKYSENTNDRSEL